jgi:hypothetical protein
LASTCGIANGTKTSSAPTSELCINGSAPSAVSQDNNGYEWSCSSLDGEGTSSNCSAPEAKGIALCGSANGTAPGSSPPTENLCSPGFGTPGPVSEYYGEYMWECDTEDATVWCGQWELGVCGAANGVAAGSPPTANLCQVGIPSTVTFSEANNSIGWAWTCTSPVPGSGILAVNCSAPTIGACGPANGVAVNYNQIMGTPYLEPYANLSILCTPGSGMGLHTSAPEFASGGSLWWECVGSAQGTAPGEQGNPVACSAPINGQCGNPDSIGETSDWAYYLCAGGIPSAVVNGDGSSPSGWNSGPWTWTCGNQPGATTVSCSQP